MTPAREATLSVAIVVAGGLVVLPSESAFGLAVLAGVGAAALVSRPVLRVIAMLVVLLAAAILAVGISRAAAALVVGGFLVIAGAGLAVVRGGSWHRSREAPGDDSTAGRRKQATEPSAKDTWAALDRGEDPTA